MLENEYFGLWVCINTREHSCGAIAIQQWVFSFIELGLLISGTNEE